MTKGYIIVYNSRYVSPTTVNDMAEFVRGCTDKMVRIIPHMSDNCDPVYIITVEKDDA